MYDAGDNNKVPAEKIEEAKADIVGTISKYVDLKKAGKDYAALCPFHSERSPSFTVSESKGIYQCFGCGAHGDAIDFVREHENLPFHEAVYSIVGGQSASGATPQKRQVDRQQQEEEWRPVTPVPATAGDPADVFHRRKGDVWEKISASRRWAYRDADGNLIGYVCRFELPGGGKDLIPQSFCVNSKTGEMRWKWLSFSKPRPIYGLEKLAKHPKAQVVIVEGEKACDKAQDRYEAAGISRDKLIVIAWPGGGKAVKHVDWAPLAGRNVGLWPDADQKPYVDTHARAGELMPFMEQPGTVCMVDIASRLDGIANAIKFITPPDGVADGWDLADDLPAGFSLLAHTKSAAIPMAEFMERHKAPYSPVVDDEPTAATTPPWEGPSTFEQIAEWLAADAESINAGAQDGDIDEADHLSKNKHFTILGFDHGTYYFFVHDKQQVMSYKRNDFNEMCFIELANDINWWEMNFPGGKNGGVSSKAAFQWIRHVAESRGVYDPTNVRGRGAWLDDGRSVYHLGDMLLVDGAQTEIDQMSSSYVYPRGRKMPRPSAIALTAENGKKLFEVAKMVRWSMPGSAVLMTGWAFLAPICGALKWRPHIWLNGPAGSGKSTVQRDFCHGLTRGISIYAQGNSTEAGIRQKLHSDALSVLVDEFESNNDREKARVESILSLIRQSSSESQAETMKGTTGGDGMNFHIRSMFCLASINTNLEKQADRDRITKLTIRTPPRDGSEVEHWRKLEKELHDIINDDDLPARLLARSQSMLKTVIASVRTFTNVAAKEFHSQRMGDQYGTLIAGCWCLCNDAEPTENQALDMIKSFVWDEHTEDSDHDDAIEALQNIMWTKVRLGGSSPDVTVAELIREASSIGSTGVVDGGIARDALSRHGIRVEKLGTPAIDMLAFGVNNKNLKAMLKDTPYSTDIRGQLLRIKGSFRGEPTMSFGGSSSRFIAVPLSTAIHIDVESKPPVPSASASPPVDDDFPI